MKLIAFLLVLVGATSALADSQVSTETNIKGASELTFECRLEMAHGADLKTILKPDAWEAQSAFTSSPKGDVRIVMRRMDTGNRDLCVRCEASGLITTYVVSREGKVIANVNFNDSRQFRMTTIINDLGKYSCRDR